MEAFASAISSPTSPPKRRTGTGTASSKFDDPPPSHPSPCLAVSHLHPCPNLLRSEWKKGKVGHCRFYFGFHGMPSSVLPFATTTSDSHTHVPSFPSSDSGLFSFLIRPISRRCARPRLAASRKNTISWRLWNASLRRFRSTPSSRTTIGSVMSWRTAKTKSRLNSPLLVTPTARSRRPLACWMPVLRHSKASHSPFALFLSSTPRTSKCLANRPLFSPTHSSSLTLPYTLTSYERLMLSLNYPGK
jgi:hypothetical protein